MEHLLGPAEWLVVEEGWDPDRAGVLETQLTVGDGAVGTRGTLEEGAPGERSGTFLAGVYDDHGSPVIDLVNAPDWTAVRILVDGTELSVATARVVRHRRALDLRQGLLWRRTVFEDAAGNRTRVESVRFVSAADRGTCVQRVAVTPENHDATVRVTTRLEGERRNLDRIPVYPEGTVHDPEVRWEKWAWTNHLDTVERVVLDDLVHLGVRTRSSRVEIGYAQSSRAARPVAARRVEQAAHRIDDVHETDLRAGGTLTVDRVVGIAISRRTADVRTAATETARAGAALGVEALLERHRAAWEERWADADCRVVGDPKATHALRFGIYHLLIAADGSDPTVNIGAKSLSGEGYRGHVFWDTEVFLLPFFTFTRPGTARSLLGYRHHTLPAARELARESGCRGARYAWESADTGREECPRWTDDGAFRFWSRDEEVHVTVDVAYGVLSYVAATGDRRFLAEQGLEILVETSRFWVDRAVRDDASGSWSITGVMGPDEFHSHVDDNAFTNLLVAWSLRETAAAWEAATAGPSRDPAVPEHLVVDPGETDRWREVADGLVVHRDERTGVIEQFAGYFAREDVPVTEWDEHDMPRYPEGYHHFTCEDTMLLKQPDVLMLLHLLPDVADLATKRANFEFYEARTLHKSSLSPAVHAILGLEVGDPARALQYFRRSAFVDLHDNQGNTEMGMHIASAAGTWQVAVVGFAGFRVRDGAVSFDPRLPAGWEEIRFRLHWHGDRLDVVAGRDDVTVTRWTDAPEEDLVVLVRGQEVLLRPGRAVRTPLTGTVAADVAGGVGGRG